MFSLLTQLGRPNPAPLPAVPPAGVAQQLLERAGAEAGRTPHEAQGLRRAAQAYLSVVR